MYAQHFVAAGFDTRLVASGERADRLRSPGITVNGEPLQAAVVDQSWPADLVIFAVKDHHLEDALQDAAVVVGPDSIVVSVMNGLDSEQRIAERFPGRTVPLCIALAMDAQAEGPAISYRQAGRLVFGHPDGRRDESLEAVGAALTRAGLAWEIAEDMPHRMWWKFMVNVGVNQASAALRRPYGAFQVDGAARCLMWALIDEVVAVSVAEGAPLGDADRELWEEVLSHQPADGLTSMHQDVEAGRPTEVNTFAGRIVELGRHHGIPTPYNQAVWWILESGQPR